MNTCRYCDFPAKRILCGSAECRRRYNADRARDYMRERRRAAKGQGPLRTCPGCEVEFPMDGKRRWCTQACKRTNEHPRQSLRCRVEQIAARAGRGTSGDVVWVGFPSESPVAVSKFDFFCQPKRLTLAYRSADHAGVIAELLAATVADGDCRVWSKRTDTKGYPRVAIGGKSHAAHRMMAEAVHGPLLGQPVHHTCANTLCLAPTHLQPVSERENIAEMLERNWYRQRIAELEGALTALAPAHPLVSGNRAA